MCERNYFGWFARQNEQAVVGGWVLAFVVHFSQCRHVTYSTTAACFDNKLQYASHSVWPVKARTKYITPDKFYYSLLKGITDHLLPHSTAL